MVYLSFKIGEQNILVMNDLVGKRYLTVFPKKKLDILIKKIGFKVLWSEISSHTDPSLPKWYSLVVQK